MISKIQHDPLSGPSLLYFSLYYLHHMTLYCVFSVYGSSPLAECKLHDNRDLSGLLTTIYPMPLPVPDYVGIKQYLSNK